MEYIDLNENTEAFIASEEDNKKKSYQKKYRCPYCNETFERNKLHIHIQNKHEDMIPEGHTALRVAFNQINHKTEGYCIICRNISPWNEDKGRYERLCKNPKCHQKYKKMVAERNKKVYGVERLQTDERYNEFVQKKALSGRKISGVYKFKDGGSHQYVGSYERNFLEFMDKVMNCNSEDLVEPGPGISYEFEGKKHLYLPDFFYIPYQLLIEIKDGGDNPNNHPHRAEDEKKNKAKEAAVKKLNKYSYVRVVNNDFSQLLTAMAVLKYNMQDNDMTPVVMTHESAILESEQKSTLDKNHKQKGSKRLSEFKLNVIERDNSNKTLKRLVLSWTDDNKTIALVTVDKTPREEDGQWYRWFGHFQINKSYRGYGLGKQIIEFIKKKYKAGALAVYKDNEIAVRLYKQCGFIIGKETDTSYWMYYPPNKEKVYNESALNESILFNDEDLYYNKDKFDSGEINLCFITGHSGSGKTTMGNSLQKLSNVEHYDLDDLQAVADHFTLIQLKEYGELYFSFFTGIGKKYYLTSDELSQMFEKGVWPKPAQYESEMYRTFIPYAMKYAKAHKNIKFVLDGIWIYCDNWFKPEEFKEYAVYIKGTSMLVSKIRAAKRDKKGIIKFLSRSWKFYYMSEKRIREFHNYFENLMKQNEQTLFENLLFNGEDLCYNRDKFNSGEINLLFITGLSGSEKTTLSKMYEDIGCAVVHLDRLLGFYIGDLFEKSRANDMIKSFYLGPGKIFIEKRDGRYFNKYHLNKEKNYEIIKTFIDYAIQYAQRHPSQQFVIEGTYIAIYTNVLSPEYFQNYAIIIKNTPICKSILQASDRDGVEDYNNLADHYNDLTISRFTNFYNYYNSKSQDLVETNMTGTIQAALPNESNGNKYYLVQHLQNNVFSHGLTKDPAQNTIYEVEPMEDDERYYKVSKTTKDKIDSDYKTFEIKNTELAQEIYNELAAIYQSENSVIYDTECKTSYLYNKLTEGGYLYDPEQLLIDPRFKLVDNPKSIQEKCYELYSYLTNKNNIDLLEAQIHALYEQMRASSSLETVEHNKWIYSIATLQLELQKHHSAKAKEKIRNTILELGWIPDIPITKESFKLFENYCAQIPLYEEIDLTNQSSLSDMQLFEAGQSKREKVPVFIVLTHSIENHIKNIVGKAIQWYTNSKWDHAEIGFDSSLDLLYTFRSGGFFISGLDYWLEENKYAPLEIKVNVLWVTPAQREKMMKTVKYYMHNIRKTSYALYNIVNIFFKRALLPFDNKFERICSQFVYTLCNIGKFDLKKPSSFVRPADLDEHQKLYKVYEGPVEKYKKFKVDRILTDLQNKLFNK